MHIYEITRRLSALGSFEITVLTTDRSRRLPREEIIAGTSVLRVPALAARARLLSCPRDGHCDQDSPDGTWSIAKASTRPCHCSP